ncbi:MAG: RHS repeat protein [Phycisphaerales bacterium]|nr:RHS repeat protein [Phycisphaerales bacterium]
MDGIAQLVADSSCGVELSDADRAAIAACLGANNDCEEVEEGDEEGNTEESDNPQQDGGCGGGDDGGDDGPNPTEEAEKPASDVVPDNPVDLGWGVKYESATDMVVRLPGRDFVFSRAYNSRPRNINGGFLDWESLSTVGRGWNAPAIPRIRRLQSSGDKIIVYGTKTHSTFVYRGGKNVTGAIDLDDDDESSRTDSKRPLWTPNGPSHEYIVATTMTLEVDMDDNGSSETVTVPVLRLVQPGEMQQDFYRQSQPPGIPWTNDVDGSAWGNDWRDYLYRVRDQVARQTDTYGNQWDYFHTAYNSVSGIYVSRIARPTKITFKRPNGTIVGWLFFGWDFRAKTDEGWVFGLRGKLRRLTMVRPGVPDPGYDGDWSEMKNIIEYHEKFDDLDEWNLGSNTITQRVVYDYHEGGNENDHVKDQGDLADLLEVKQLTRLDDDGWRTRFWQYRYYRWDTGGGCPGASGANQNCGSVEEPDEDWDHDGVYGEKGSRHFLKMAFYPRQIEYVYERANPAHHTFNSVDDVADKFRGQPDEFPVHLLDEQGNDHTYTLAQLANKVISYDLVEGGGAQFSESRWLVSRQLINADCGCGGPSGSHRILRTYNYDCGGDCDRYADIDVARVTEWKPGQTINTWEPYRTRVMHYGPFGDLEGRWLLGEVLREEASGGRVWVHSYQYHDPPADANGDYPKYRGRLATVINPSAVTSYNAGTGVVQVGSGLIYGFTYNDDGYLAGRSINSDLVESYSYRTGPSEEHLLSSVTRHASATVGETTTFDYGFGSIPGVECGPTLRAVQRSVERELPSENGLAESGTTFDDYALFDSDGEPRWSISGDLSLTERDYDVMTSAVIAERRNVGSSSAPSDFNDALNTLTNPPSTSFRTDGGALEMSYEVNLLGQVTKSTGPGGVTTEMHRHMAPTLARNESDDGMGNQVVPTKLLYAVGVLPPKDASGNSLGAAVQTWYDASDAAVERAEYEVPQNFTDWASASLLTPAGLWSNDHDLAGNVIRTRQWHDVAQRSSLSGAYVTTRSYDPFGRLELITNPVGTVLTYTYNGRDDEISQSVGTTIAPMKVTEGYAYDEHRAVVTESGSSWWGSDEYDPQTTSALGQHFGASPPTGRILGGESLPTTVSLFETDTTARTLHLSYDDRNRQLGTVLKDAADVIVNPSTFVQYDNLGRAIERIEYIENRAETSWNVLPSGSDMTRREFTFFSQRGLPYRSELAIDPTSPADRLSLNRWFDEVGRPIKVLAPDSPVTKVQYDGLGRTSVRYVTDGRNDEAPGIGTTTYSTPSHLVDVSDDTVYEQVELSYKPDMIGSDAIAEGQLEWITTRQRAHDESPSSSGSLSGLTNAIASFVFRQYDAANRLILTANAGTNSTNELFEAGGSAPAWTQATTSFGNALLTPREYDAKGRVSFEYEPDDASAKEFAMAYFYDDLDRVIGIAEAFEKSSGATLAFDDTNQRWKFGTAPSSFVGKNRFTTFVYDGLGNVTKRVAHLDATAVQETAYDYGLTTSDGLARNDWLARVRYPLESGPNAGEAASDTLPEYNVVYDYNRLGEVVASVDQNQTRHEYERDGAGRVGTDTATDLSGGLSGVNFDLVDNIRYLYNPDGTIDAVQSKKGGTVVNELEFDYNSLDQLTDMWQNPGGSVDRSQNGLARADVSGTTTFYPTGVAHYGYELNASSNRARLSTLVYPYQFDDNGTTTDTAVNLIYDQISRLAGMGWEVDQSATSSQTGHDVTYGYVGLSTIVEAKYAYPDLLLSRWRDSAYSATDVPEGQPGAYAGLDQFGRVTNQFWAPAGNNWQSHVSPGIVDFDYGYDVNSNITERIDGRSPAMGTFYDGDRDERYEYADELDRLTKVERGHEPAWTEYESWAGPNPTDGLDILGNWQTFSFLDENDQLQTESRTHNAANEILTQGSLSFVYDAAGNLITQDLDASTRRTFEYDAWNRLVRVGSQTLNGSVWEDDPDLIRNGYYGLNQRAFTEMDGGLAGYGSGGASGELDRREHFYYDASWRLLERRADNSYKPDDPTDPDTPLDFGADSGETLATCQFIWGARYIDELVYYQEDLGGDGYFGFGFDPTSYVLTDRNFSVVRVDENGERIRYDAYGESRTYRNGDANNDGTIGIDELNPLLFGFGSTIGQSGYSPDLDVAGRPNGVLDIQDLNFILFSFGSYETGPLSSEGNIIGYAGYVHEPTTDLYLVRNKRYVPVEGWLSVPDPFAEQTNTPRPRKRLKPTDSSEGGDE